MNNWTPMTERRPTEADLPIWYSCPQRSRPELFVDRLSTDTYYNSNEGAWMKAQLPAVPPRKTTPHDRDFNDMQAFNKWLGNQPTMAIGQHAAWNAALAYRDAENAKDLANVQELPAGVHWVSHRLAVHHLKERAGVKP